jgi:uncharacterized protein (DUF488 family)
MLEDGVAQIPIYTIGHGNRTLEEFISLLQRYKIAFVIDVRSQPHSHYTPHFSCDALQVSLHQQQMRYVFMGDALGGRPEDEQCYVNGKPEYAIIKTKPFFLQGIERLRTAWEKQLRVALLCSEAKPQQCHRSKLIGNTLIEQGITVAHIDERGLCKEQAEINTLLTGGQQLLFADLSPVDVSGKIGRARKRTQGRER